MNNPPASPQTLSKLLIKYVIAITLFMGVLLSYVIQTVYEWGSDDSTHYFMQLSAESFLNNKQSDQRHNNPILNVPDIGNLQVYASLNQAPSNIQQYFSNHEFYHNQLLIHETSTSIIYLLPYDDQQNRRIFVTSEYLFSGEDLKIENYMSSFTLITVSSALVIAVFLMAILWRSILTPIKRLMDWSSQTKDEQIPIKTLIERRPTLNIHELDTLGHRIADSINTVAKKNDAEKQFLKSLSHELRTPLAITKASLELIHKTETSLSDSTQRKIAKIKKANDNMCATSDALLWLWSGEFKKFTPQNIDVGDLIDTTVDRNRYLIASKNIDIHIDIADKSLSANPTLLDILIRNLVRNAFQYTPEGHINIRVSQGVLVIENTIGTASETNQSGKEDYESDYGFGVGVYLSKAICESQGWGFKQSYTPTTFVLNITLH